VQGGGYFAAGLSAASVGVAGAIVLLSHEIGDRSGHMALHIVAMNVLAPLAALSSAPILPRWLERAPVLWVSAAVQIILLWAWHLPALERIAAGSHHLHGAVILVLFLSAFLFWSAVICATAHARWHTIAALMVTGKLTCLLSALLVFSPRHLYGTSWSPAQLQDQQLAGLLMITACPLSYLIAAIVIVAKLIAGVDSGQPFKNPGVGSSSWQRLR
jgi:putative membrane protein